MNKTLAYSTAFLLFASVPAFAHGQDVLVVIAIDLVLFVIALLVIGLMLKCPRWMRALLIALYVAVEIMLYSIPTNLVRPPLLENMLHWVLPTAICLLAYVAYRKSARVAPN